MSSDWRDILPCPFDCYRILMKNDLKLSFLVYLLLVRSGRTGMW